MFLYYFPPQYAGAALQAISLAKRIKNRGIDIKFVTVNHDDLHETDEVEGFKVYRILEGKGRFSGVLLWKDMWKLLKREKKEFDILHSHGAYLRNSFVGPLSKLLRKKSLVKVSLAYNDLHGLGVGKSGWLHKWFISMVDRYVSTSKDITSELRSYRLPQEKIREIPNGVDTERFSPARVEEKAVLRKKAGLPENGLMLLYVGGISKRKNVKWLVESWDILCSNYPGFLVVVGPVSREDRDMSLYNSLKAYENKLSGKLFIIQFKDKIEDFYKMADIFILPSTNEGMPNVVLEAMSSGLPCLVNKVSGVEDMIDVENGLIFDVQEPHKFFDGLFRLKDASLRSEMGRKAREAILNKFSLVNIAERYICLYEEMLKE
jgi:glycosyltransferase involved in cell wall biosynthesis